MTRVCGILFVFAFLFLAGPVSAQFALRSGYMNVSLGSSMPNHSQVYWTISDNVTFSSANIDTPTGTPDSFITDPILNRGGTRGAMVWVYQAADVGRGDVHVGTSGYLHYYFSSINHEMPQTRLTFTIGQHALPKLTATQTGITVSAPFTMEGSFAIYNVYESTAEPRYATQLTGNGTVTLSYNRRVFNVKTWRRNPNAELYLSFMSFTFAT